MTDVSSPSLRPFWKRKRWVAAGVLWLVVAYPASFGPVAFFAMKGWLTPWLSVVLKIIYLPLESVGDTGLVGAPLAYWVELWMDLAD